MYTTIPKKSTQVDKRNFVLSMNSVNKLHKYQYGKRGTQ